MLEIEGPRSTSTSHKQSERKVNPLGKANKRFLGRTINTAIRHNRREKERTQANCRQKLKDLDDIHERRKSNYFYNGGASRNSRRSLSRSCSSSRSSSASRSRSRRRAKKSKKRRSRKRSSSRSSKSPSRSRSCSERKKNKKKTRKHRKSHHRSRRRSSSSSRDRNSSPRVAVPTAASPPTEVYLEHSKQMALAVAMAYGQVLKANSLKAAAKERESSPMSDIVKELMSDGEDQNPNQIDALSISSNDIEDNVLTIDVSSNSASGSDSSTESSDTDSEAATSAGSCIALDQTDNNNSDIEIIECPYDKEKKVPEAVNEKQQVRENPELDSVDLTED
ncbi:hypothetical protein KR038_006951 [Drosophila bunnanda]|nr:hypothetical protein KR038_006951 [Drosophila bunnanda]